MALRSTVMHHGRVCSESDLLPPAAACCICGFDGPRPVVLTLQSSPPVHLLNCPRCHAASASRMPSPETLAAYYSEYYSSYGDDAPKPTFDNPGRLAAHIARLAGASSTSSSRPLRVLDFGGGDGSLSRLIAGRLIGRGACLEADIDLVDYSEPAASADPRVRIRRIDSLQNVPPRNYDLVLASSIMEHVPDARPEFQRLFAAIAPGGCMYARTPWIAPVMVLLQRLSASIDFTFPAHVHDFGKDFWEGLTSYLGPEAGGLKLVHSRPSIVESGFREAPARTVAAYLLKAPWWVCRSSYQLVGGWEVLFTKNRD